MKRVMLVRHAKSSWKEPLVDDHDRQLNPRGLRDAPIMAEQVKARMPKVDLIVSSTAQRAMMTAEIFSNHIAHLRFISSRELYHAPEEDILACLHDLESDVVTALVFGHNPGMTHFYNMFADNLIGNLPTCGVFELVSEADDWHDMDRTNTKLVWSSAPKTIL
ncbi:MAG: histidine phosphatase family protein [Bacteroidota bacterium]